MDNNIDNRLTIHGSNKQINEVLEFIKVDEANEEQCECGIGTIDFNKITPMPLGFVRWYGWRIENWGTKYNAYEQLDYRNTDDTIYFKTSDSEVSNLIKRLSVMFPDVYLEYEWSDKEIDDKIIVSLFKNGAVLHMLTIEDTQKKIN